MVPTGWCQQSGKEYTVATGHLGPGGAGICPSDLGCGWPWGRGSLVCVPVKTEPPLKSPRSAGLCCRPRRWSRGRKNKGSPGPLPSPDTGSRGGCSPRSSLHGPAHQQRSASGRGPERLSERTADTRKLSRGKKGCPTEAPPWGPPSSHGSWCLLGPGSGILLCVGRDSAVNAPMWMDFQPTVVNDRVAPKMGFTRSRGQACSSTTSSSSALVHSGLSDVPRALSISLHLSFPTSSLQVDGLFAYSDGAQGAGMSAMPTELRARLAAPPSRASDCPVFFLPLLGSLCFLSGNLLGGFASPGPARWGLRVSGAGAGTGSEAARPGGLHLGPLTVSPSLS